MTARRIVPWLPWLLRAVVLAAAVVGLVQMVWHARLFAQRLTFPLDLEWMEGGMLVHARRLASGQSIYVKPSLEFIPFLYTPLYPALLALVSKLAPLGYVLGRMVSIVSFAGSLAVIVYLAIREAGRTAALIGLAAAGAVVASYEFTGAFYDLVRNDSLVLLLEAGVVALAFGGRSRKSAAGAGVLIALAFFTKQTASLLGIGIGVGLLAASWRRGFVYGISAAVTLALGILFLVKITDGWFWTYVFKLHQSHPFRWDTLPTTPREILRYEYLTLAALVVVTVGLALGRRLERRDFVLAGVAAAGLASGIVGFATMWAWQNAWIPAVFFPTMVVAVLGARLVSHALATMRPGAVALASIGVLALGAQSVRAGKPNTKLRAPTAVDRAAAERFLVKIRSLPGDGFIPFHPYYSVLAGKKPFLHRMGVMDVREALGRPEGLDQAMDGRKFSFIVLDWKHIPYEWPGLEARYRIVSEFRDGVDTVRNFSGADTWPRYLILPIKDGPPIPAGGRTVTNFETGRWEGWTVEGGAFGPGPWYATDELFGKFAADSGRFGPAQTGSLRSTPLKIDRPHLRFVITGPTDAALSVSLMDGANAARVVNNGSGKATVVDWDVSDLIGHSVTLVVQDRSPSSGIAIDEIVAY